MEKKQSKGQALLEKLEEVITHADINSKQAIKSASFGIEQTVEILHGRKKKVEDAWEERRKLLEQSVKSSQLDENIKKCSEWLRLDGDPYINSETSFGNSSHETDDLLKKHKDFEYQYKARKEFVHHVIREGQKLIHSGHFDSATIKYKIGKLEQTFMMFSQQLELRLTLLEQTEKFWVASSKVMSSVDSIYRRLQSKQSDHEKAKCRLEATEVSVSMLREGQILMTKTKNKNIGDVVKVITEKYNSILSLTEDQQSIDDKDIVVINKDVEHVTNWYFNICEEFLSIHRSMGANRISASEFEKDHQQLFEELNSKSKDLTSIKSSLSRFSKKKKKQILEISEKLEGLQTKSTTLTSRIKYRVLLVKMYYNFLEHSDEVLKKIFLLEEELTSDEPHENINATRNTLNRQKQEKEEIINSAEILQEEGQRILEDLGLCSEESVLDRNAIKLKIGKDLKSIVMHTMQLEELWDQRETQLDNNKRLSTQFFEFEKEIRKVIGCIHDQSETFFPLSGEFPGLTATHKDLEEKRLKVQNVSKLTNVEIENHLNAAESLAQSSEKAKDSAKVVTSELKLVHERFKTKLSKYEALLSICSTFYTSVEKLVALMNRSLQEYTSDFLPRDTLYAQQKSKDHFESYRAVDELFVYTVQNGQDVLQSIKEYEELDLKSSTIDELISRKAGQKDSDWKEIWEGNQLRLEESLKILQHLQDISQITLVVEEYTRKLLKINRNFGNSLLSAVTLCQESDSFQDQVKETEQEISQLRISIDKLVQAGHNKQLESKLLLLEKRWIKLVNLMEEHKALLNTAVEFYQICDQVGTWVRDSNQFLKTTRSGAKRCTSEKDVYELIQLIENFQFSGVEVQESRLLKLSEVSTMLGNDDAKRRATQLKDCQEKINVRLEALKNDLQNQIARLGNGEKIDDNDFDSLQWDDDGDLDSLGVPEKRITLASTPDLRMSSDVSLKGDEIMKWSDNLEQESADSPKLLVTVSSSTQVPPDMQQRLSPIVHAEMKHFNEYGATANLLKSGLMSSSETLDVQSEVKTTNAGSMSVLGPHVKREVSVKTDYDIEASQPSPAGDDQGLMYTMKKTLITTTKEVTTRTKQEIKTELEVIHIDSEDDLPKRLALTGTDADKVGVSVTTKSGIDSRQFVGSEDQDSLLTDIKGELQAANENICKGVEQNLFKERSTVMDDSLMLKYKGENVNKSPMRSPNAKYEVSAKDVNNKGISVRHIPKGDGVSIKIKLDEDRPVSMVELTLNLDGMDYALSTSTDDLTRIPEEKTQLVVEEEVAEEKVERNVESIPLDMLDDYSTEGEPQRKLSVQQILEITQQPKEVALEETKLDDKPAIEKKISDSTYANQLVDEILKESVSVFDVTSYIKQLVEEEENHQSILTCTVQNYLDKIAVAPLKLQKNKEAIFRNVKELVHFHKNVLGPKLKSCQGADDVADVYLKHREKMFKLYYTYLSKSENLENILSGLSFFQDCRTHKTNLREHLNSPQDYMEAVCLMFENIIKQKETQKKDTTKLKLTLQVLKDTKDLVKYDSKKIANTLKEMETPEDQMEDKMPVEEDQITSVSANNVKNINVDALDNMLEEYDIISSDRSAVSADRHTTSGSADWSITRSPTEPISFENKQKYIVSKVYTAKLKDEIHLPLGSEVCILDTSGNRNFVVALNRVGQEFDRGWIPSFCLQKKEDAVDITSNEAKLPEFLSPLNPCTVVEGNVAKLAVQVAGHPKPELVWYLDGLPVRHDINHKIIEEGDKTVLYISPAIIDDEGMYTVKAVNTLGSASCQAEFIVESDVSSMSGLSDLEWEESTVPAKNKRNQNQYLVGEKITFSAAIGVESEKAFIPPSFVQKLKDKTLVLGTKASFQVKVEGEPLPNVSWYLNNMKLNNDKRLFEHKEKDYHTLEIASVSERDQGTLKCEITNPAGIDSCTCTLRIGTNNDQNNNNDNNTNPFVYPLHPTVEILENKDAELIVCYGGEPKPEIHWYRDDIHLTKEYGVEITLDGKQCKMILPDATIDDSGIYTCIAKNKKGEEKSEVNLVVLDEKSQICKDSKQSEVDSTHTGDVPELLEQFLDKEVYEGDTASFQVKVASKHEVAVQWHHENQLLQANAHYKIEQNGQIHRLVIPVIESHNAGKYSCVVKNINGECKCSGSIIVHDSIYAPKFIEHSKDLFVERGQKCILQTTIKAKPLPTVEWYKDNKNINENEDLKFVCDENKYSLVISKVNESVSGSYKCVAFNNAGESACIINVTVMGEVTIPKFVEPLCDINADMGDTVKLESTVLSKSNVNVTWLKDGEPLRESSKYKFELGDETHSLTVHNLNAADSGLYKCQASNEAGESVCECNLHVNMSDFRPKFLTPLPDIQVPEHENGVELKVVVVGDPRPDVLFYKDGVVIESSARRRIIREGEVHSLYWKYVLPDDTGEYAAVATNDIGEEISQSKVKVVTLSTTPTFSNFKHDIDIFDGDDLVLMASASGVPIPQIQWFKNGKLLGNGNIWKVDSSPGHSRILKKSTTNDSGEYECVAENMHGKAVKKVTVVVKATEKKERTFPPEFSTMLMDTEIIIGNKETLQAGYIGFPEPTVKWRRNSKILPDNLFISENGISKFTLSDCKLSDAGSYECVISNEYGEAKCQCMVTTCAKTTAPESSSKPVEKSKAPKFLVRLHDVHTATAEPLILETVVNGDPFPDIRWYKQDKLLHPNKRMKITSNGRDGKSSLRVVNVGKDDAGEYECVAKNKHGETSMSCEVFVKDSQNQVAKQGSFKLVGKPVKPTITDRPKDPCVNAGDLIEFKFTVQGNPRPKVEILKDNKLWKSPPRIATIYEKDTFTFRIPETYFKDEAVYEFLASNDYGKDSFKLEILVDDTAELEVVAKTIGERKHSKEEQEMKEKSSTSDEETNQKTSHSRPPSKRWKKRDKIIPREKDGDETDSEDSEFKVESKAKPVEEDVIASVMTAVEHQSAPSFDDMEEPPEFIENFSSESVSQGKALKLEAKIKGTPPPSVVWFKDGKELKSSSRLCIEQSDDIVSLLIENSLVTDSGEYTCLLDNMKGEANCAANINILQSLAKPEWIEKLKDASVTEGEKAVLEVLVTGNPSSDVLFYYDNRAIVSTDHITIISDKESGKHTLIINKTTMRDSKTFKCVAKNSQGTVSSFGNLKVQEAVLAPQFLNTLQDSDVVENREIKFKLEVTGKPKPIVEWFCNEQLLKPSSKVKIRMEREFAILLLSSCKFEDSSIYKAVASNIAGEVSTSCQLQVLEDVKAPDFIYVPKTMKTIEGRASSFRVSFNGRPDPIAEWFLNGEKLESASVVEIKSEPGKSMLSIKSVALEHAGTYTCNITNKSGATSCNIDLVVDEAQSRPLFVEKLKDVVCMEGETLNLNTSVKGKPVPSITWLKDDTKMTENERISITNDKDCSALVIFPTNLNDIGVYKVSARNALGESSSRCKVLIDELISAPVFETGLADATFTEGECAELTVIFNGKPKPRLRWLKDGVDLEGNPDINVSIDGYAGKLKFSPVKLQDEGIYECHAQNKSGIVKTSSNLEVIESLSAPVFTKKPSAEMELLEGDVFFVDFQCTGNPLPDVEFSKDGKKNLKGITCEYKKEKGQGLLKISGVAKLDEGMYKVAAKNSEGASSFTICMQVKDAGELMFTKKLEAMEVLSGENASLEVRFQGQVVDVDWYKDNEYIDESEKYEIIDEESRCTCIISSCNVTDSGNYRCEILNEKRSQSCSAKLLVLKELSKNKKVIEEEIVQASEEEHVESQPKMPSTLPSNLPVFTKPMPPRIEVTEGKEYVVNISADGKPKPKLTFYKDGEELKSSRRILYSPISKDTTQLKIKDIILDDEGEYSVKASNAHGVEWSKALLFVQMEAVAPKFILKPIDLHIIEGESTEFKIKVSGSPVPIVRAYHESAELGNLEIEDDYNVCKLNKCQPLMSGKYKFEAVNTAGKVTSSAMLLVQEMVKEAIFEKKLSDTSVTQGDDIILDVAVDGNPPPAVSFLKDGKKLSESKSCSITLEDNRITLKLLKSKLTDQGTYSCEIRNDAGNAKCEASVNVELPPMKPTFLQKLENVEILEGDSFCLEVEVDGIPEPEVVWTKNGKKITDMKPGNDEGLYSIIKPECEITDEGIYTVTASNASGEESCSAEVKIRPAEKYPYFEKELEDATLMEKEKLILEVICKGYPPPLVMWYKDGEPLDEIGGYVFENDKKTGRFGIVCKKADLGAAGIYTAVADNDIGEHVSECEVVVEEKPVQPAFIETFTAQVVDEGTPVSLLARITGKPAPEIMWYRSGEPIESNIFTETDGNIVDSCLQLPETVQQNSGYYVCVAKNSAGEVSHSAKVTVREIVYPPEFEEELADTTSVEKKEVSLYATCQGTSPFTVKWTKNGRQVHNTSTTRLEKLDSRFSLRIPKPATQDSATYGLEISNRSGSVKSSCVLTVTEAPVAPTFAQKLRDVNTQSERDCEFPVRVTGKPEPEIHWYLNDIELENGEEISVITKPGGKGLLKIKPVSMDHQGILRCEAVNAGGTASSTCKIKVSEMTVAPDFVQSLSNVTVCEGDDIIMKATVSGKPNPSVVWSKDKKRIEEGDGIRIDEEGQEHFLIISEAQIDDQGKYKITARNKVSEKSSTGMVTVNMNIEAPVFITLLEDSKMKTKDSLVLFTEVVGSPPPQVVWVKDGQELTKQDGCDISENEGIHTLEIKEVKPSDSGVYACIASNEGGEVVTESDVFVEEDKYKPVFLNALEDCSFDVGSNIVLSVVVDGVPVPEVNFYKDKKILKNIDGIIINSDLNSYTVTIEDIEIDDCGVYQCKAQNECGEVMASCFVKVTEGQDKPVISPVEGIDKVTTVKGGNATLEVEVFGNPTPTVEWARDDLLIDPTKKHEIIDEENYCSLVIHDVHAGDVGDYTCIASNNFGEVEHVFNLEIDADKSKPVEEEQISVQSSLEVQSAAPLPEEFIEVQSTALLPEELKRDEPPENSKPKRHIPDGTAPSFSMKPKNKDVLAGTNVRFTCNSSGLPDPMLYWYFEDKLIEPSEKYQVKNTFGLSTLIIKDSNTDDIGSYRVVSDNEVGQCEATFSLSIEGMGTSPGKKESEEKPSKEKAPKVSDILQDAPEEKRIPEALKTNENKRKVKARGEEQAIPKTKEKPKKKDVPVPKEKESKKEKKVNESSIAAEENNEETGQKEVSVKEQEEVNHRKLSTTKKGKVPPPPVKPRKISTQANKKDASSPISVEIEFQGVPSFSIGTSAASTEETNKTDHTPVEVALLVDTKQPVRPSVAVPLEDLTLIEGEDVMLKAEFLGHPALTFSWFKDEIAITNSPRIYPVSEENIAMLVISNAKVDDEADYICIASNSVGECETVCALLVDETSDSREKHDELETFEEVDAPPKSAVSKQAQSSASSSATEKARNEKVPETSSKVPPPTTKPKPPKAAPKTAKKPTKPAKVVEDVVTSHESADVQAEVSLQLEELKFLKALHDSEHVEGDTVELEVILNSNEALEAEWELDGDHFEEEDGIHMRNVPPSYKLCIDTLLGGDEGEYSCTIKRSDQEMITSSCMITINEKSLKPEFVAPIEATEADAGEYAEFRALVAGSPIPEAEWYFNNEKLELSDKYEFGQEGEEHFLIVNECVSKDSGEYTIKLINDEGETSCSACLLVLDAEAEADEEVPLLVIPKGFSSTVQQEQGTDLHLEVDCDSESQIDMKWMKDGKEIKASDNVTMEFDGVCATIEIKDLSAKERGTYVCKASNNAGESEVSFDVQVKG